MSCTPEEQARGDAYYNYTRQSLSDPERAGISVFYRDPGGTVFHTYCRYARGLDMVETAMTASRPASPPAPLIARSGRDRTGLGSRS